MECGKTKVDTKEEVCSKCFKKKLSKSIEKLPKKKKSTKEKLEELETQIGFVWNKDQVIHEKNFVCDVFDSKFCIGLLLPENTQENFKNKKGEKVTVNKQILTPVWVTSEGELMKVNYSLEQKNKIKFSNLPSRLPDRWELEDIKKYLDGAGEKVDGKKLLELIINQYTKSLYIYNTLWYKVHAVWDLGTYFYMLFEAFPFIELRGITGTGKSKSMIVSSFMSFNGGTLMVNPSEPSLFREKDEVRGTSYFDEAEKLWTYNPKSKSYEGDARTELINASYSRGALVPRMEKEGNRWVTKWYTPYSPLQLSSIAGLYGATETRAITRITTKSPNEDPRGEHDPSEERDNPIWGKIRDLCYRYAFENWEGIKKSYKEFPKDIGLKRRDYQIWKPLLAILKYIDEESYEQTLNFAIDLTKRRMEDFVPEGSFDRDVLRAFRDCLTGPQEKVYIESIKRKYCLNIGDTEKLKDRYLNRNISSHLDKFGFKEFRNKDREGSYFAVGSDVFNVIITPICPELVFLSSPSSHSSQSNVKQPKTCDDKVTMRDDDPQKDVTNVTIGDENDDDLDMNREKIEKIQEEFT